MALVDSDRRGPGGPIAIGGVGGSGTRVVAGMLRHVGYHIGDDLNESLDNLWFTFLFRRPSWVVRQQQRSRRFDRALRVFVGVMHGRFPTAPLELTALVSAYRDMTLEYDTDWARARIRSMRRTLGPGPEERPWGWKEPNTHVVLAKLASALPNLRYVHVVRHGLDMAFSDNQHQLGRWGELYGITDLQGSIEDRSARFWLAANRRALAIGQGQMRGRFHVMNFDRLVGDPLAEVNAFLDFIEAPRSYADSISSLIRPPQSIGRHENHLDRFSGETIEAVTELMSGLTGR